MARILVASDALASSAFADAQRKDQLARVTHHRHAARHTRASRLAVTWAAATVALMLMGAAGDVLCEALTAPQERGIMDRPY